MRVLLIDIDTLRADHLGCYGYGRNTSPNIDAIASEGIRFNNYYCSDAPCMPSRTALITGMHGIHTGAVGHGGTVGDLRLEGDHGRKERSQLSFNNLVNLFRQKGMFCASISTFAERHSAFWFNMGFNEMINMGGGGMESAESITPDALDWLDRKGKNDDWLLHVHYWDPHTPYRAPAEFGNPFAQEPLPDDWITQEIFDGHLRHVGPHGANEINMWNEAVSPLYPRHPGRLHTLADVKHFIDNYDTSVKYADVQVGYLLDKLKELGIYEDVNIIVTSDHGEDIGELGMYGEHGVADNIVCRIPLIIKWKGGQKGICDDSLHTNVDFAPTMAEMLELPIPKSFEGKSYKDTILYGTPQEREFAVLSQCCHVCQRSVRFDDYIYIRNYHGGYHLFDDEMLFDIKNDPHETKNLAQDRPDLCGKGARYLERWVADMMKTSKSSIDPLWTVIREGGPMFCWGRKEEYIERLKETGRGDQVTLFEEEYRNF